MRGNRGSRADDFGHPWLSAPPPNLGSRCTPTCSEMPVGSTLPMTGSLPRHSIHGAGVGTFKNFLAGLKPLVLSVLVVGL
jgi:hypothetical protein